MTLATGSPRFLLPLCLALFSLPSCKSDDGGGDTAADEHGAGEHGASEASGSGTAADTHDHSVDSDADDPAVAYCSCVFANCHEPYHAKWGEDEMAAEAACLAEAGALPSNGGPTEMGNFIECRQHFCDAAAADPTVCTNALGDAVCM
ncbi:MAG: hypothetical protein U0168_19505 [Nannocystaceae bacterium]